MYFFEHISRLDLQMFVAVIIPPGRARGCREIKAKGYAIWEASEAPKRYL